MSVTPDEFRSVLGRFPSGVTVVTTKNGRGTDEDDGERFLFGEPRSPLVLICIEKNASAYGALTTAAGFVVNILAASQEQIARRFSIVDINRFEEWATADLKMGSRCSTMSSASSSAPP